MVDGSRIIDYVRFQNAVVSARCAVAANDLNAADRRIEDALAIGGNRPEYRALLTRIEPIQSYLNRAPR